jgi:hypothetical protein
MNMFGQDKQLIKAIKNNFCHCVVRRLQCNNGAVLICAVSIRTSNMQNIIRST